MRSTRAKRRHTAFRATNDCRKTSTLGYNHEYWKSCAANLNFSNQTFIDGKFASDASGKTFYRINPATGAVLKHVAECDAEDVAPAIVANRTAFEDGRWSRIAPSDSNALQKLADLIRRQP